jgi:hypothetical protein
MSEASPDISKTTDNQKFIKSVLSCNSGFSQNPSRVRLALYADEKMDIENTKKRAESKLVDINADILQLRRDLDRMVAVKELWDDNSYLDAIDIVGNRFPFHLRRKKKSFLDLLTEEFPMSKNDFINKLNTNSDITGGYFQFKYDDSEYSLHLRNFQMQQKSHKK